MARLNFRSILLGAMCAALTCGASFAGGDPSLTFCESYGHYRLEGTFYIDADQRTIWSVLTDYTAIPSFIGSMKISRIETRSGNDLVLYQEPEGGFLLFTKRLHLTLDVHETPERSITFKDTSLKDFDLYQGSWCIQPLDMGETFQVTYQLEAKQNFDAPAFIASDAVSGGARDLLRKVRDEILRRKDLVQKETGSNAKLTQLPRSTPTLPAADNGEDN